MGNLHRSQRPSLKHGKGNESHEGHGSDESHEGHEEEANLLQACRRHLFAGKISKTASGMGKGDFVKNKSGKIVSKTRSALSKKSPWIVACQKARKELKIKGFAVIKKGTPLYKKAKELYSQ